jgi:hypothetical protein
MEKWETLTQRELHKINKCSKIITWVEFTLALAFIFITLVHTQLNVVFLQNKH